MREAQLQDLARPGQNRQCTSFQLSWDDPFTTTSPKTIEAEPLVVFKETLYDDDDPLEIFSTTKPKENMNFHDICDAADLEIIAALSQSTSIRQPDGFHNLYANGGQNTTKDGFTTDWGENVAGDMTVDAPNNSVEDIKRLLNLCEPVDKHSQLEWDHRKQSSPGYQIQRPHTPPNQISFNTSAENFLPRTSTNPFSGHLPMTPATTPFRQDLKQKGKRLSRTAQSSPVRRPRNDAAKVPGAQPMKRGSSCQDSFTTPTKKEIFPSPPNTVPMKCPRTFEVAPIPPPNFMDMSTLNFSFPRNDNGYESSHYSPGVSPTMSSFQSSPELTHLDLFTDLERSLPRVNKQPIAQECKEFNDFMGAEVHNLAPQPSQPSSPSKNPSDTSFGGLIENTGITAEEISSFIEGPDTDNKYRCRYPDCDRTFGRKENIKAHVQTHLNDRQFLCEHCPKRFVRQHDLKRHGKTHTNAREYRCACGSSFARHDALTRHRQRGMCSGAFPNTPRKEAKRGRPKKGTRPETPERLEKAARTRQRVLEKAANASSPASSSDYSLPSPAAETFNDVDMRGTSPFDNLPDMNPMSYGVSPNIFSLTPPTSPGYSTGNSPAKGDFPTLFESYEMPNATWGGEDFSSQGQDPFIWDG
ncbi:Metallothionein expression activator [Trapelia coarctata]|nr:Metallothionein expression activator [Trapelia coarctata]